uniref:Uncharacterized protein n=1 Tax=Leersia perrieri TaxID=77586 RepID=A0A0D9WDZ3_9ORYZ
MGALLVHLPTLAGACRPSPIGLRRDRCVRLSVSAAVPNGPVKEVEEEEEKKGRKERIVIRVSNPMRERRLPSSLFSSSKPPAANRETVAETSDHNSIGYPQDIPSPELHN